MKILPYLFIAFLFPIRADFFKAEDFEAAVGLQGQSLLYKRGIVTYEGFQLLPVYSIQLFNPDLLLAGSALYYQNKLSDQILLRTRLNFDSTGDDPLYTTSEEENERVRRETTAEWDIFIDYVFSDESFLRLTYSQDLIEHEGQYAEIKGRWAFWDIYPENSPALIQLGLFSSLGFGSEDHNQYFYGAGAKAGVNNWEVGLSVTSPKVIDYFWPTFKVSRFEILGEENRNATFVQEKSGWAVEFLLAFQVL